MTCYHYRRCAAVALSSIGFLFVALAQSVTTAGDVRRNETGGFSIYTGDGEYVGCIVPNDTGG